MCAEEEGKEEKKEARRTNIESKSVVFLSRFGVKAIKMLETLRALAAFVWRTDLDNFLRSAFVLTSQLMMNKSAVERRMLLSTLST